MQKGSPLTTQKTGTPTPRSLPSRRLCPTDPDTVVSTVYGVMPSPPAERGGELRMLFEVLLCTLLFPVLWFVGAGMLGAWFVDVDGHRRAARAELLVHDTTAAIAAYSFDAVKLLHGASFLDAGTRAESEFRVDLEVAPERQDLLRVQAVLRENASSREVGRVTTYRGRS
jgi:hypothetical protein